MSSRVSYIDNLRTITVSLLIIYHLAMAYNTWGEANYIFFEGVKPIASIVVFISPWFMPLMFLLAGIGAFYSLKKRNYKAFIKERLIKLGIPLIFGLLVLNPILSYVADLTHNGYLGNYFNHYGIYFSRVTDLSGYDGGFTLGHLWFIAVLIVISILSCGIIKILSGITSTASQVAINVALIIVAIMAFDVKFLGKPLITYLCVYLLGYYLFSNQGFVNKLVRLKWIFVGGFIISSIMNSILFVYVGDYELLNNICNYLSFATGIPALICLGNDYLNYSNSAGRYCSKLSYVFYIVHFPIVVLCQYFIAMTHVGIIYNFVISFILSLAVTCGICWIIEKSAVTRFLFGLRKK